MNFSKLRRQIAHEAARLLYERQESEYYQAKMKAARRVYRGWVKPKDLPSNAEIRDEVQNLARIYEGNSRDERLLEMRLEALRMMKVLDNFRPKLIGSVFTGHIRKGSDIDLHVFSDSLHAVTGALEYHGFNFETVKKHVVKNGEAQVFRHVHVADRFKFELTVYPESKLSYKFKSSITGKPIEKASIPQLEEFLANRYPELNLDAALQKTEQQVDRFALFYSLLLPLENVIQSPKYHPEGDALYHSLQVYDLACDHLPYDEEFLLAALLHDVGKGIDKYDHVQAGLEAVGEFVTERTAWLIEHHMEAHKIHDGTIGHRALRRLRENESFDELVLLGECDRGGRQIGVMTTDLEEALNYIREISDLYG